MYVLVDLSSAVTIIFLVDSPSGITSFSVPDTVANWSEVLTSNESNDADESSFNV